MEKEKRIGKCSGKSGEGRKKGKWCGLHGERIRKWKIIEKRSGKGEKVKRIGKWNMRWLVRREKDRVDRSGAWEFR